MGTVWGQPFLRDSLGTVLVSLLGQGSSPWSQPVSLNGGLWGWGVGMKPLPLLFPERGHDCATDHFSAEAVAALSRTWVAQALSRDNTKTGRNLTSRL